MSEHEWHAKRDAWVGRGCQGDEDSFDAGWTAGRAYEADLRRLPLTDEDAAEQLARGLATYAAPPHYGDTARPFPVDLSDHGDVRERWSDPPPRRAPALYSSQAIRAAQAAGIQLQVTDAVRRAMQAESSYVAHAVAALQLRGVALEDIEIVRPIPEPPTFGGPRVITWTVQVREREFPRPSERPDPREIAISMGWRGGDVEGIRLAALGCTGVEDVEADQIGPMSVVLRVAGQWDQDEVRAAVEAARPGGCDVRIVKGARR